MVIALGVHAASVALFLLLGVWVLLARPRAAENRVLGILLLLLAGSTTAYHRFQMATASSETLAFARFLTWYEIPFLLLVPLLLHVLFLGDEAPRSRRLLLGAAAVVTASMLVLHFVRPTWFHTIEPVQGVATRNDVVPQTFAIVQGVLLTLLNVGAVALAAVVARDRDRTLVKRRQAAFVGAGFSMLATHSALTSGLNRRARCTSGSTRTPTPSTLPPASSPPRTPPSAPRAAHPTRAGGRCSPTSPSPDGARPPRGPAEEPAPG
jgi:hypothetical protein